jgi:hypothetical protein
MQLKDKSLKWSEVNQFRKTNWKQVTINLFRFAHMKLYFNRLRAWSYILIDCTVSYIQIYSYCSTVWIYIASIECMNDYWSIAYKNIAYLADQIETWNLQ